MKSSDLIGMAKSIGCEDPDQLAERLGANPGDRRGGFLHRFGANLQDVSREDIRSAWEQASAAREDIDLDPRWAPKYLRHAIAAVEKNNWTHKNLDQSCSNLNFIGPCCPVGARVRMEGVKYCKQGITDCQRKLSAECTMDCTNCRKKLSAECGVDEKTISAWLDGKKLPPVFRLALVDIVGT